jgi:hypothetical protein
MANIDTSRGSLERRASAIPSRARSCAAGKLTLGLQALVYVPSTATHDRKGKPATGRRRGWSPRGRRQPFRRGPTGSACLMKNNPETAAAVLSNPSASADAHQHAREEIEERVHVTGRALSRSWLLRLAAVAAGLIAAELARRLRAARTTAHDGQGRRRAAPTGPKAGTPEHETLLGLTALPSRWSQPAPSGQSGSPVIRAGSPISGSSPA